MFLALWIYRFPASLHTQHCIDLVRFRLLHPRNRSMEVERMQAGPHEYRPAGVA
jgi:hypothetical protein